MCTSLRLMKVILLCGALSLAFPIQAETQRQPRKKVGLVLSGGGAKGVAHIGVLKVLEEAGIPIDYIAGTSMGAIVGGLYCIGYSPDALDSLVRAQNWLNLLADKIARDNLLFMEKEVNDKALLTIPFDRDRFYISTGILSGSSVMDMLSELTRDYHNISTFDSLPIPFACIGYDLLSGDEVVMREGSLPVAIRASMSIPGAFSTVERDGKILIDGGVINNFPADVVKEMGADIIIGVNVGSNVDERTELSKDPLTDSDPNSLLFIMNQMMKRMGKENFDRNILITDLYIQPDTDPYTTASFTALAIDSLMNRGEQEAYREWENILAFKELIGLHPADDIQWPPNRPATVDVPFTDSIELGYVIFDGLASLNEKNLRRMIRFKEFSTIHVETLRETVGQLKGTGSFSVLRYSLQKEGGRYNLWFHCEERARSAVSMGARFDTRDIASGYIHSVVVPRELKGGMVELNSRLSTNPYVQLGVYYQDAWLGKFGFAYSYRYGNIDMFLQNDTTANNVRYHQNRLDLDIANFYYRNFNLYVGMRFENFRSRNFLDPASCNPETGPGRAVRIRVNENLISYRMAARFDSYDDAYYPTEGVQFVGEYNLYTDNMTRYKESPPFSVLSGSLSVAVPLTSRITLLPSLYARFIYGSQFAPHLQNAMGGPFSGHYIDHQMPLYGFKPMVVTGNKSIASAIKTRFQVEKNHYLWAVVNVARMSQTTLDLIEWNKGRYLGGVAAGYSYNSPVGPIDIFAEYGLHPGSKFGIFINIGKYF